MRSNLKKNGYDYNLIIKVPEVGYIFSQSSDGAIIAYEVFKHKFNRRFNVTSFPSNESFGVWAWTYHDLSHAVTRLNHIIQNHFDGKKDLDATQKLVDSVSRQVVGVIAIDQG